MAPKTRRGVITRPDLPGLFPTHDGSYGINTHINIDPTPRKGHGPNTGMAQEQADDRKWVESMEGEIAKRHSMNSDLKKAINESHKKVEEEEQQGQASIPGDMPPSLEDHPNPADSSDTSSPSNLTPSPDLSDDESGDPGNPGKPPASPKDSHFISRTGPRILDYTQGGLPFPEEYDDRPRPPYVRAALPLGDPYAHAITNPYVSPLAEDIPFYGIPQGEGSKEPITVAPPDSSRNFNYENGLFANAVLRSPGQITKFLETRQPTTQGSDLPAQSQPTGWPGFMGSTGTSPQNSEGQSTPRDISSWGEPIPERPTSGWQPISATLPLNPPVSDETSIPLTTSPVRSSLDGGVARKDPAGQIQSSNNQVPRPAKGKVTQRNLPRSGGDLDSRRGWVWPSPDLIIRSVTLFSVSALVLWFAFSALPGEPGDNDTKMGSARSRFDLSNFSIGTMWEAISDRLPSIPDMPSIPHYHLHNTPSGTGPSHNNDISPKDLLPDLKKLIPEWIWVQTDKGGKLKIPEDFWHALRDLIEGDKNILKLKNLDISEDHWRAIESRIRASVSPKKGISAEEMEVYVEDSISRSWHSWLKQNHRALKNALSGVALTKDDFAQLFQQEMASSRDEIRKELAGQQEQIAGVTQRMSKLRDQFGATRGVTKDEATRVFNTLLSKAVKNLKLEAVAQGLIRGHANDVLANQINFFGIGSGIAIDPDLSSSSWIPPKPSAMGKEWHDMIGYTVQPRMAAFSPWTQEGECFCAGTDRKGYGQGTNNISVVISRRIIPQHFVVEHILPGATLDPGAMPKEIEVWAEIEEVNLRNEVRTFSETQFPGTLRDEAPNDGFIKIGHFTYENKNSGDGVQVFKISDELTRMGAVTSHILVRAINNYGADHTCFYRLRLYGEVVERPDEDYQIY